MTTSSVVVQEYQKRFQTFLFASGTYTYNCGNLDISKVTDNRAFWKIKKVKMSDRVKICSKFTLVQSEKILSQDTEITKTFNKYFKNITILNIPNNQSLSSRMCSSEGDTITGIIVRYKKHPSINFTKSKNSYLFHTFFYTQA